jgi:hypothetical protein
VRAWPLVAARARQQHRLEVYKLSVAAGFRGHATPSPHPGRGERAGNAPFRTTETDCAGPRIVRDVLGGDPTPRSLRRRSRPARATVRRESFRLLLVRSRPDACLARCVLAADDRHRGKRSSILSSCSCSRRELPAQRDLRGTEIHRRRAM